MATRTLRNPVNPQQNCCALCGAPMTGGKSFKGKPVCNECLSFLTSVGN